MLGASLSEVWGDDFKVKPKKKKRKSKSQPLTPDEMDSELLVKDEDKKRFDTNEYRRESSLRGAIQPYDHYSGDYYSDRYDSNKNVVTAQNPYGRLPRKIEDDPEYAEFMEFKAMKQKSRGRAEPVQRIDRGHQLNELLLYVFTGFFLLVIYDNIYRLGKKSY